MNFSEKQSFEDAACIFKGYWLLLLLGTKVPKSSNTVLYNTKIETTKNTKKYLILTKFVKIAERTKKNQADWNEQRYDEKFCYFRLAEVKYAK